MAAPLIITIQANAPGNVIITFTDDTATDTVTATATVTWTAPIGDVRGYEICVDTASRSAPAPPTPARPRTTT